jgi:hypothetical protein
MQISAMVKKVPDGRKVAMIDGMLHGCKTWHHMTKSKLMVKS